MNDAEKDQEIQKLKEENQRLRKLLKQYGIMDPEETMNLTKEDKIRIYMEYFRGRSDLYSKYYWKDKSQSFAWVIDCAAAFSKDCLIKKKEKIPNRCFHCKAASFRPLTKETVLHLFKGDRRYDKIDKFHGIGIYPLLKDNTCYFLALDFDDDNWLEEMKAVYDTAVSYEFYPVMERSQSGAGGHLWFFFATNVKAFDARRMGEILLEKAMNSSSSISFASFDRMFPSQDYAPADGAGNFIALPLRYDTYINGNSALINAMGQVIKKPIEYLLSRPKITQEELLAFLNEHTDKDYFFDDNQLSLSLGTNAKYVNEIHGILSEKLIVEKRDLNAATMNVIRRSASMWNPEYLARQRRHEQIYYKNTPRVLHYEEEDEHNVYLPSGVLDTLKAKLPETKFLLENRLSRGTEIPVVFSGELRPMQKEAVQAMTMHRNGVLKAVTAFGKTVCSIWMIAYFHVSTLIIVDRNTLLEQWNKELEKFLRYPSEEKEAMIGKYNGRTKKLSGKIDIASVDSLANIDNLSEVMKKYGMVIIDECHHVAADTYMKVMNACGCEHIYGLSATPEREDGKEKVIYMYCGPVRFQVSEAAAARTYEFRQLLVPRYTASAMLQKKTDFKEIQDHLMHDPARNWMIVKDIAKEYKDSGKIIVLSDRIEHLEILAGMLEKTCENVYLLTGRMKDKERRAVLDKVRCLANDQRYILVTTTGLLGEGFDLPSLKTMFLVLPFKSRTRVAQYTGRIHRNYEGKDVVKVYDYVDPSIPVCMAQYQTRLKQYQKEGYLVEETAKEVRINQFFFEGKEYLNAIQKDIQIAKKEIILFARKPNLQFIQNNYEKLQEPLHQGTALTVILPELLKDSDAAAYLSGMGASVVYAETAGFFLIIDQKTVWISNQEFLSENLKRYCTREENPELASELLHSLNQKNNQAEETGIFALELDQTA